MIRRGRPVVPFPTTDNETPRMMTVEQIEDALKKLAEHLGLKDPDLRAEMPRTWVHILIATPSFEGKSASERENMAWRGLEKFLDDETLLSITQCYLLTPAEMEEAFPFESGATV